MRQIVLYGLLSMFCVICGCVFKSNDARPSSGVETRRSVAADKSGIVKQPLFKKPDFTAQETAAGERPVKTRLAQASECLAGKQYEKVPPILEEIVQFDTDNKEALDIANEAYYSLGRSRYKSRQFIASRYALIRVSPDYKDTKSLLASVRRAMARQVDMHYKRGVKYFINEELENAIAEWEAVLVLDPGHLKAADDIENARQLLKKVKKITR